MVLIKKYIFGLARYMDKVGQLALVAMMTLVVVNVTLRAVAQPILGAYEFVTFLGAVAIAFPLAYCAVQQGHIAVTLLTDSLKPRPKAIIEAVVTLLSAVFFVFAAWQVTTYASDMIQSGEVSPTTRTPFYPFVYGVALSLLVLALVILVEFLNAIKKAVKP